MLTGWVVNRSSDRLLDPSCGDGRFLAEHSRSVGVELDAAHARAARERAPWALVHGGDFFQWSAATNERFEAIAGNPPFIRYQSFTGEMRSMALSSASLMGADFSALTSSWAPFVIVAAGLLKAGGRMAFVVPAEIGHAGYARTLLPALCRHFDSVHIIAYREKLFPQLSEDCWLLYCEGFGGRTSHLLFSAMERFVPLDKPPSAPRRISLAEWREAGERLRPFLLPPKSIALYRDLLKTPQVRLLGDLANANIGYVSGANDFFHLRPKEAKKRRLPEKYLRVTVRNTEQLPSQVITNDTVRAWIASDEPVLLLDLNSAATPLPREVSDYLEEEQGIKARASYKCRHRNPWFAVPDIKVPDGFLSVMSGTRPSLVRNEAGCVCTNSLHAITMRPGAKFEMLEKGWHSSLATLGSELEGHPLGGGMLKLEPREAARIPLPVKKIKLTKNEESTLAEATREMRLWRHHA